MKMLIDDARIENIREIYNLYPMDGVTTNPSILAKSGRNPYDVLREIRAFRVLLASSPFYGVRLRRRRQSKRRMECLI